MIGPFTRAGAMGAIDGGQPRARRVRDSASIRRDGPDADQRERALAPLIDMARLVPGAPTIEAALSAWRPSGPSYAAPRGLSAADRAKVVGALEIGRLLLPSQPA